MADEHETRFIIRRYPEGDLIALMPDIDEGRGLCASYMHIGQHGAASRNIAQWTKPVNESDDDVMELVRELRSIGYRPRLIRRMPRHGG